MSDATKREIKALLEQCGLKAEFRADSRVAWAEVISQCKDVPSLYMEHLVNYQTVHFNDLSSSSTDISLVLYHDKFACGVWPLVIDTETTEPLKSINNQYGGVVVPPLFIEDFPKKSQRTVVKACIELLNKVLQFCSGECWRTNEASLTGDISQWYQVALEAGALLDKISYEMHLDLTLPIVDIRKHIRKSYRPLISSGMKSWQVTVMDDYCEDTWNQFRELHRRVAGRTTRSIQTWNIQHQAIKSGDAFLVYVADSDKNMVGGGYFDMSEYQCQYSVGTYDKQLSDQPLGHMIQYEAILKMKEAGRRSYYLGDRFYQENLPDVSKKQVNISNFKQGFSSQMYPRVGLIFSNGQ